MSCQVFCEKCPAGQYVDKSSYLQSCYACPAGKYADEEGTSECTDCPVGKAHNITSADDSSTCADCRVGQYQDSPGSTACTSCDAGQYQGAVGKTYCDSCTVGWYQVIPTPSHLLDRISPISSPKIPVFCAFSPPRRGGSNKPKTGIQGQETVSRAPKHRFAGPANSGCSERMV